jgi:hypothetical protein
MQSTLGIDQEPLDSCPFCGGEVVEFTIPSIIGNPKKHFGCSAVDCPVRWQAKTRGDANRRFVPPGVVRVSSFVFDEIVSTIRALMAVHNSSASHVDKLFSFIKAVQIDSGKKAG